MKVVAVSGERKGDRGTYLGTNGGLPPCHVEWEDFGQGWWVQWHDVEIAEEVLGDDHSSTSSSTSSGLGGSRSPNEIVSYIMIYFFTIQSICQLLLLLYLIENGPETALMFLFARGCRMLFMLAIRYLSQRKYKEKKERAPSVGFIL